MKDIFENSRKDGKKICSKKSLEGKKNKNAKNPKKQQQQKERSHLVFCLFKPFDILLPMIGKQAS